MALRFGARAAASAVLCAVATAATGDFLASLPFDVPGLDDPAGDALAPEAAAGRRAQQAEGEVQVNLWGQFTCGAECRGIMQRFMDERTAAHNCSVAGEPVECEDVYVALMMPFSGFRPTGASFTAGVFAQMDHINRFQQLLPGIRVNLVLLDSKLQGSVVIPQLVPLTRHKNRFMGFFGGDPAVAQATAILKYAQAMNQVPLSFTPKHEPLVQAKYPDVVNHYMSELTSQLDPSMKLAQMANWRTLAVVTMDGDHVGDNARHFHEYLESAKQQGVIDHFVQMKMVWSYAEGRDMGSNGGAAAALLQSNIRIVFIDGYEGHYVYLACQLYKAGRRGYVFLIRGGFDPVYLDYGLAQESDRAAFGCTPAQVVSVGQALNFGSPNSWVVSCQPPPPGPIACGAGQIDAKGAMDYSSELMQEMAALGANFHSDSGFSSMIFYDMACHWALMVHEMLHQQNYSASNLINPTPEVRAEMIRVLQAANFKGAAAQVEFLGRSSRQWQTVLLQMRSWEYNGPTRPPNACDNREMSQRSTNYFGIWAPLAGSIVPLEPMEWYNGAIGWENAPTDVFPTCTGETVMSGDDCAPCADNEVYLPYLPMLSRCVCVAGYRMVEREFFFEPQCEECPAGFYSSNPAETSCTPCPMGFFTSQARMTQCESCTAGFYQNQTGQDGCHQCPPTFTTRTSLNAIDISECVCPEGKFWHKPTPDAEPYCEECPEGLVCPGGGPEGVPQQQERFSAGPQAWPGAAPAYVVKCATTFECPGGTALASCPPHRRVEPGCGLCEVGYMEDRGDCVPCAGKDSELPIVLTVIIGLCAAVCLYAFAVRETSVKSQTLLTITITAGLVFNTLQVLSAFKEIAIDWPEPLHSLFNVLQVLTFRVELLNPGCIFGVNEAELSYLGAVLAFPAFCSALLFMFLVAHFLPPPIGRRAKKSQVINSLGLVMLAFYTGLSIVSVLPLQCETNPDGSQSVVSRRTIICWEGSHFSMLAMSAFAVLAYIVTFFSTICWATMKYKGMITREGGIDFLARFQFLFERFTPQHYYYGILFCLRNLTVALLPVVFANDVVIQLLLMALVITGFTVVQCWLKPWRTRLPNVLDAIVSVGLVMVLVGGTLIVDTDEAHAIEVFKWFCVVVVTAFSLTLLSILATCAYFMLFPTMRYGVFLCHHKVGAGALARWMKMELKCALASTEVFLDSDNLQRLDVLFEQVGYATKNLVVIQTRQVLERIWCAGEIATAHRRRVHTFRVQCNDFEEPSDDFIAGLGTLWSEDQKNEIARLGVDIVHIQSAFENFRKLPALTLDRSQPFEEQGKVVNSVVEMCRGLGRQLVGRTSFDYKGGTGESELSAVVVGDLQEAEQFITCIVLKTMLQQALQLTVTVISDDPAVGAKQLERAKGIVPVLNRGILEMPQFAQAMCATAGKKPLVPVVSDASFAFPTPAFWEALEGGEVVSKAAADQRGLELEAIAFAYKTLFGNIALYFTPHGGERLQETQVAEVAKRFKAYQEKSGSRSRDGGKTADSDDQMRTKSTSREREGGANAADKLSAVTVSNAAGGDDLPNTGAGTSEVFSC